MLQIEGIKNIRKIKWKHIQAGMILIGNIKINGAIPEELRDFPVLSPDLLSRMTGKYYFLAEHEVLIADSIQIYCQEILIRLMKNLQR